MSEATDAVIDRIIVRSDGCWDMEGRRGRPNFRGSYTQISTARQGGSSLAHKHVYEILVGPAGNDLHHACGNKGCVNIAHLRPLDRKSHMAEHSSQGSETCVNGHPWAENGITVGAKPGRVCRSCRRDAARRSREKGVAHV